jgi:hypothetical protein
MRLFRSDAARLAVAGVRRCGVFVDQDLGPDRQLTLLLA